MASSLRQTSTPSSSTSRSHAPSDSPASSDLAAGHSRTGASSTTSVSSDASPSESMSSPASPTSMSTSTAPASSVPSASSVLPASSSNPLGSATPHARPGPSSQSSSSVADTTSSEPSDPGPLPSSTDRTPSSEIDPPSPTDPPPPSTTDPPSSTIVSSDSNPDSSDPSSFVSTSSTNSDDGGSSDNGSSSSSSSSSSSDSSLPTSSTDSPTSGTGSDTGTETATGTDGGTTTSTGMTTATGSATKTGSAAGTDTTLTASNSASVTAIAADNSGSITTITTEFVTTINGTPTTIITAIPTSISARPHPTLDTAERNRIIIGGAIGGVVLLALVGTIGWFILRWQKRWASSGHRLFGQPLTTLYRDDDFDLAGAEAAADSDARGPQRVAPVSPMMLLRPRGSTGSIFHEGGIWPPPREGRLQDPLLTASDVDLSSIVDDVMGQSGELARRGVHSRESSLGSPHSPSSRSHHLRESTMSSSTPLLRSARYSAAGSGSLGRSGLVVHSDDSQPGTSTKAREAFRDAPPSSFPRSFSPPRPRDEFGAHSMSPSPAPPTQLVDISPGVEDAPAEIPPPYALFMRRDTDASRSTSSRSHYSQ